MSVVSMLIVLILMEALSALVEVALKELGYFVEVYI